jgi:hypothetical protein
VVAMVERSFFWVRATVIRFFVAKEETHVHAGIVCFVKVFSDGDLGPNMLYVRTASSSSSDMSYMEDVASLTDPIVWYGEHH